jgi:hypothetical protein
MRTRFRLKFTTCLLAAGCLFAGLATAGEPVAYRVLTVDACPQIQPTPAAPYAYGWFGANPRVHATRHFGYYKLYTEWSWR